MELISFIQARFGKRNNTAFHRVKQGPFSGLLVVSLPKLSFKAMFTLLRIRFYPFSFRSVLPVHIAPGTFEYAMKTTSVHIAPLQVQRKSA